jgi:conjugal transfer mating pair stabilization protein TraN
MKRASKTILGLLLVATARAHAQAFDEGLAAGRAANPAVRNGITTPAARDIVPGYTTTPAETATYRQPDLASQAAARLAACSARPDDPVCQAQLGAVRSANLPREWLGADDPNVLAASTINRSPSLVLEDLASFYSGCQAQTTAVPAGTETRTCTRRDNSAAFTARRDLDVRVERVPSCEPGSWFAHAQVNRNASDVMIAEAQCRIDEQTQRLRFHAAGSKGACIDWQTLELSTTLNTQPEFVTDLSPHWENHCWSPFKVVRMPGSGCLGGQCRYEFQFGTPRYACPPGAVPGDTLSGAFGAQTVTSGPADPCFVLTPPDANGCAPSAVPIVSDTALRCATPTDPGRLIGADGWTVPLTYAQPTLTVTETDTWQDSVPALDGSGRCRPAGPERCVDGPSTHTVQGRELTRACWSYETPVAYDGGATPTDCAPLVAQGCTFQSTTCQTDASGSCGVHEDRYSCPVAAHTTTAVSRCPANVFCVQGQCFDTRRTDDPDFARSLSMLEAAREAGVYLDTAKMQVFKGEANRCRDRLLKNCCASDGAGRGMSNQSMFGVGSHLVFDVLMNAENREFITAGLNALLLDGGFSGSFTTYGVTVAVNGTALPAGSIVLSAGDKLVVAFDPWSLAISVVLTVALDMLACNEEEAKLALKEGAHLCHSVGTYCSSCLRVLGSCVSCIEETTAKCCFSSVLARVVNEQGRRQVAKTWGSADQPDCSGFTIAQLQSLDFAAMDLSEFYASLAPTLPDPAALQSRNSSRAAGCYFGAGRC